MPKQSPDNGNVPCNAALLWSDDWILKSNDINEQLIKMQCFARNAPKWLQINSKCFRSHFERNGGCKILR